MSKITFSAFAGVRLEAEVHGAADDPSVLLIHDVGAHKGQWQGIARALVDAGRRVVLIDLRGHGASEWPADGRYDDQAMIADLRAVLAQLHTRPVILAAGRSAILALQALGSDAATLATGIVVLDDPGASPDPVTLLLDPRVAQQRAAGEADAAHAVADPVAGGAALVDIRLPALIIHGDANGPAASADSDAFATAIPDAETLWIESSLQPGGGAEADRSEAINMALLNFLERRLPRSAAEFRSGSDARTLRDALGCFATGVTVVTAIDDSGRPVGLTANSFTSLSLDPPLLLVCVANSSGNAATLRTTSHFTVNVLQIGQQPTSNRFAGKAEDRFAATDWAPGETGTPVLAGSLSAFECAREAVHEGGDHFILVGRVLRASFDPQRDPLLYFRGKYRRLHFA